MKVCRLVVLVSLLSMAVKCGFFTMDRWEVGPVLLGLSWTDHTTNPDVQHHCVRQLEMPGILKPARSATQHGHAMFCTWTRANSNLLLQVDIRVDTINQGGQLDKDTYGGLSLVL